MTYIKKHKKGIIGTALFHIIVLLLLIFLGFFTPLPLPGEEGILVNFGTSEQGLGDVEPAPQRRQPDPPPPTQSEPEPATTPPPQPATPPPVSQPEPAEEVAMTQDYEETASIDAAEKKRQEEAERQRQLEEQRRRQQQQEQQRIAEAEKQQQAEIERQRQAELERQRQAEADRKRQEEEQRRITEINSRAQGAFSENTSGTGGQGTGTNQSQGATFPGGNQGSPTGDPNAGTYGPGGSGGGNQGTGISHSIEGRDALLLPKPVYPGNEEGVVVVRVTVDKNGNVTAAEPGARGTTISDPRFYAEARQAALKAKFNRDENAPAFQQGTISYRFRLD
jgi:colicin import membrane protein